MDDTPFVNAFIYFGLQ